ncbi:BglG family transcription antiterminator [Fusobacterium mortiferum]|uniref:BglG family transcription antiterminator n=1 Tax=Fusobacterium mortiferum TaxID=850 RepID=UPI000E4317C1|nr:PTS sugar transporter subunit IIA [Fusobacterium mortiferum]RGM97199.1 PRD domain-containing protein [Fusobacterium mortiferum]
MTLSTRNLLILDFLIKHKQSSIKEIAEKFNISESSARYDLKNIEVLIEKKNANIEFLSKGNIYFNSFEKNIFDFSQDNLQYILTSEERVEFLEIFILLNNQPFNIQRIIEILDITRNTFKSDFEKVKQNFYKMGITLNNDGTFSLKRGSSRTYILIPLSRLIKRFIFQEEVYYYPNKFIFNNAFKHISYDKINIITQYIREVLERSNKILSDESYQMLIAYIIIVVETVANNYKLQTNTNNEEFFKSKEEFKILTSKKYILEEEFKIKIDETELIRLTNFFLGSQTYTKKIDFYENWIRSEIFIEKFIRDVSSQLKYNLTKDTILFNGLLNHLKPAVYRIKNKINLENSIYEELILKEKKLFDIVKKSIENIPELKEISNDEIAYLVVYFKASIERIEQNKKVKKKILVVCNFGYGTSRLLSQNLHENYEVEIVATLPVYELKNYKNLENIDYILTTTTFNQNSINIPIIQVNPILDKNDFALLDSLNFKRNKNKISLKVLINLIKNNIKENEISTVIKALKENLDDFFIDDYIHSPIPILNLKTLLPAENIVITDEDFNWKNAIWKLGDLLIEKKLVSSSYIKDIIKIVEDNGTYMVVDERFGIFHAKNNDNIFQTSLMLLVSKKQIQIKDKKTHLILILASKDGHEHLQSLIEFSKIFESKENIDKILKLSSNKRIFDFISKNI